MRVFRFLTLMSLAFALQPALTANALNEAYPNMAIAKIYSDAGMKYRVVWSGWYDARSSGMNLELLDGNNKDSRLFGKYRVFIWDPSGNPSRVCMQYRATYMDRKQTVLGRIYDELEKGEATSDCPGWNGLGTGRGHITAYGFPSYAFNQTNRIQVDMSRTSHVFLVFVNEWQPY